MNAARILGIIFIVAGALGLIYGGFSYTKESTKAKLGPLELKVQQQETVNVPMIVSVGALALGVLLIVVGKNK